MARFFIDRPVFAWVISLLIMLGGIFAIRALPVAQYPDIAPPVINIWANYPGASAQVVEESVTAVIEREMNGAPGLMYTSATSSAGSASITLTFKQGVNPDLAAVEVQNRLKTVEARLPEPVRRDGVSVEKAADNIQLVVTLTSDDGRMSEVQLGELASANVVQALRRVEGVGKVQFWGAEYALRIWPDPTRMTSLNLTATDLVTAIRSHNARVTVGDIGNQAVPSSAPISATVLADGQLRTPEEFGGIALRTRPDGSSLYLRDVARVEFGGSDYSFTSRGCSA
jgi:multidrug efflux pump